MISKMLQKSFNPATEKVLMVEKDMRIFSSLYFPLRVFESFGILILYDLADFERWFARGTLFSLIAVTIALYKPYKKSYMNITDALLLSHMALICHILSSNTENMFFVHFMQTLILIPFAVFTVYILIRIIRGIYKLCF